MLKNIKIGPCLTRDIHRKVKVARL